MAIPRNTATQTLALKKQKGSRARPRRALRAAIAVAALGICASCLYGAITADPRVLPTASALLDTVQVWPSCFLFFLSTHHKPLHPHRRLLLA